MKILRPSPSLAVAARAKRGFRGVVTYMIIVNCIVWINPLLTSWGRLELSASGRWSYDTAKWWAIIIMFIPKKYAR